jgi:hypothetical protein
VEIAYSLSSGFFQVDRDLGNAFPERFLVVPDLQERLFSLLSQAIVSPAPASFFPMDLGYGFRDIALPEKLIQGEIKGAQGIILLEGFGDVLVDGHAVGIILEPPDGDENRFFQPGDYDHGLSGFIRFQYIILGIAEKG